MKLHDKLLSALKHYQAGDLHQAENIYRKILRDHPVNSEVLNALAIVLHDKGEIDEAITYYTKAIELNPGFIEGYYNLGDVYFDKGLINEAINCFHKVIELNPDFAFAYNNLGNALRVNGQTDEAVSCFQKTIELNPFFAPAYINLGNALKIKGQIDKAISCFQKVVQLDPTIPDSYYNLGVLLQENKEFDKAVIYYKKALQFNPNLFDAHYNLGIIFRGKKQFEAALTHYRKALELNPYSADTCNNLGGLFQEIGQLDKAIMYYREAIEFDPKFSEAYNNLGNALQREGLLDDAITFYQKAIKHNQNFELAYTNLGAALQYKGEVSKAIVYCRKAIQLNPDYAEAHLNLAFALLSSGNFKEGWKEYEWRWKLKNRFPKPKFLQPQWDGSDITEQTIFIYHEQGLGDTIQFARYIPLVAKYGAKLIFGCQEELKSLMQNIQGVQQALSYREQLPEFNVHCPLLTLPLIFNTTLDNIPSKIPYIVADSQLTKKWQNRISDDKDKLKIGIVWASGKGSLSKIKSISLIAYSHLAEIDNIIFYSLQKGEAAYQAKNPPKKMNLVDYTHKIHDFSDTASLIEHLDLIITVDTAVAHLAGALGKPVWVLLPFERLWPWMANRNDSPWYPTMKLFRQPSPGDWESVMAQVKDELLIVILNYHKILRIG